MSQPTLPLEPDSSLQLNMAPKVRESVFGDGYTQFTPRGINNSAQTWNFSWERGRIGRFEAVIAMLEERGGWQPFLWQPPRSPVPLKFICKTWSIKYPFGTASDIVELSFEATQVYL